MTQWILNDQTTVSVISSFVDSWTGGSLLIIARFVFVSIFSYLYFSHNINNQLSLLSANFIHIQPQIDIVNKFVYNTINYMGGLNIVTISEQIKVLCVRSNISMAELARRLGKSPQALNAKLKRESFTIEELEIIAEVVDAKFLRSFELSSGDKIWVRILTSVM